MKRSLRVIIILVLMLSTLLILTGCGEDKLVAIKTEEEDGVNYEEKMEVYFKDDKVDKVKATFTFDSKETAQNYVDMYNGFMAFANALSTDEEVNLPKLEQKGKKAVVEFNAEQFAKFSEEESASMSKQQVKSLLEVEGYTVK